MRAKRVALAIAALGVLALLTACDWFAEYTVVNETDQELITWALLDNCDKSVGHREDYLHEKVLCPHDTLDYFWITGTFPPFHEPDCIQVATKDRRVVLSAPYEHGATYTVKEPLQPLTAPIPKQSDLPREPFGERFSQSPFLTTSTIVFNSFIVLGAPFAALIAVRFFWAHGKGQAVTIRAGPAALVLLTIVGAWLWMLEGLLRMFLAADHVLLPIL